MGIILYKYFKIHVVDTNPSHNQIDGKAGGGGVKGKGFFFFTNGGLHDLLGHALLSHF